VGEQPGIALAAVEQRDRMSAGLQRFDEVGAQEPGAAEDQDAQLLALGKRWATEGSSCAAAVNN
jgi:hypothetical protein